MNPSAPVTSTGDVAEAQRQPPPCAPGRAGRADRRRSSRPRSRTRRPVGLRRESSPIRSGIAIGVARPDPGHDLRLEGVDPAVDLALDRRLLVEPDDAVAVALDASERYRVEVAPDARSSRRTGPQRGSRAGAPRSAEVTRSPFMTSSGSRRRAPAGARARRAVPSGRSSRRYSIRLPNCAPSPKWLLDDVGRGS